MSLVTSSVAYKMVTPPTKASEFSSVVLRMSVLTDRPTSFSFTDFEQLLTTNGVLRTVGIRDDKPSSGDVLQQAEGNHVRQTVLVNSMSIPLARSVFSLITAVDSSINGQTPDLGYFAAPAGKIEDETDSIAEAMKYLVSCDFGNFVSVWEQSTVRRLVLRDVSSGSSTCGESNSVVMESVRNMYSVEKSLLPILKDVPQLKLVHIVSDPRHIYYSQYVGAGINMKFQELTSICEELEKDLDVNLDSVKFVVLEHLIDKPQEIVEEIYSFIGRPFSTAAKRSVDATFLNKCSLLGRFNLFSTCSDGYSKSLNLWKTGLSDDDLLTFQTNPSCVHVAKAYGFPLGFTAVPGS